MNKQPPSPANTEPVLNEATVQLSTDPSDISNQPTIAGTGEVKNDTISDKVPTLPGYSITGVLGRGGMGVVYNALQRPLNRPVALKMIISGEHAGAEDRLRFLAEAESISKIQHPGIVQLYEFGNHEGHPYFALEYVAGGTLEKKLSGTPLPPREAAALVEKLARAMQAAHDLGIVHRDLKPANVLLTVAGEPKITDFGLAKSGGSNLTATGAILGTPSYMAPEQADGQKSVGAPADVYALGAILYECLTGRPPFKGPTHLDTILQVVNNEPVSVRYLQATTPQDLETICHKCLAKESSKRYATMNALAEDLRRYLHNEPIDARPVGRVEKAWRWCRRNPATAALIFVSVLALLGLAGGAFWYNQRLESTRRQTRAVALVEALPGLATPLVPRHLKDLEEYRKEAEPLLREQLRTAPEGLARLHTSLALLLADPKQADYLTSQMMKLKPDDLVVVRDALRSMSSPTTEPYWKPLLEKNSPPDERLRAAAVLAAFDPQSKQWPQAAPSLAAALVEENPLVTSSWLAALKPVREKMLPALASLYRQPPPSEKADDAVRAAAYQQRGQAIAILAEWAGDQPALLADLLADADARAWKIFWPKAAGQEEALHLAFVPMTQHHLLPDLAQQLWILAPTPVLPMPYVPIPTRIRDAQRRANVAIALARLGYPETLWPLLQHSPDPTARSYALHRLSLLEADVALLLKRWETETDVSAQRAILLGLGNYGNLVGVDERARLSPTLLSLYRDHPDPGLHAAVRWLLLRWGHATALAAIEKELATGEPKDKRLWYVTKTNGHTFVVIPGPVEFLAGSPPEEPERIPDEALRPRKIPRSLALADTHVTVAQLKAALPNFGHNQMQRCPEPGCAVLGVNWYQAAEYCNWLSEKEGIPTEHWCYEPTATGEWTEGMKIASNHLERTGYRLPTQAEWEYANRAGATTAYQFGQAAELLPNYAWYDKNSQERTWPVQRLRPNDLGLFEVHGTLWQWMQLPYRQTLPRNDNSGGGIVREQDSRELRGGTYSLDAGYARSAYRNSSRPSFRSPYVGFRPVRTLNPVPFTDLPK